MLKTIAGTVILPVFPPEIQAELSRRSALSLSEQLQEDCDQLNAIPGKLTDYDCPECLNRGFSYAVQDEIIVWSECRCKPKRRNLAQIKQSGLSGLMELCTFEAYETPQKHQQIIKSTAERFLVEQIGGKWLYIGGQNGAGKTHICTAVASDYLRRGKSVKYMLWRDETARLKACVNDDIEYAKLINPLKTVDVLYIDDLFKTGKKWDDRAQEFRNTAPTPADIIIAFEILNYRYINRQLVTIISGERNMDELMEIDEAVGSRIYERSKEYCVIIPKNPKYNYRMRT